MPVIAAHQEREDAYEALKQWLRSDADMKRLASGFEKFTVQVAERVLSLAAPAEPETLLKQLEASLNFPMLGSSRERTLLDEGEFVTELAILVRRHLHLVGREEDRTRVMGATLALARAVVGASARNLSTNPAPRDALHQVATRLERDRPSGMTMTRLRSILARVAIQLGLMDSPAGFSRMTDRQQDQRLSNIVRGWRKTR